MTDEEARQFAFDLFTSDADGLTAAEAMELTEEEWAERITHWEPFENWTGGAVRKQIDNAATDLIQRLRVGSTN